MESIKFGEIKKSSAMIDGTMSSKSFDLNAIYRHMVVGDIVTNLKYNNKKKTVLGEEVCSTFNNQISIKMKNGVNIKIFNTGAFSISGAGTVDSAIENARETLEKILVILRGIRLFTEITPGEYRGFYTYYGNRLLTQSGIEGEYVCDHFIKNGKIIINGEQCVEFDLISGVYVQVKHKEKRKKLYNNIAVEIGSIFYNMKRRTKSLCIKDCVYVHDQEGIYFIMNKYGNCIGTLEITITGEAGPIVLPEMVKLVVSVCEQDTVISELKFSNHNCNMQLQLQRGAAINRSKICEYLNQQNIRYTYDPCAYPGVKFAISNVKITVFRTGSVLFSAKKDIHEEAYPFVIKMFENDFIVKTMEEQEEQEELTIWDL